MFPQDQISFLQMFERLGGQEDLVPGEWLPVLETGRKQESERIDQLIVRRRP